MDSWNLTSRRTFLGLSAAAAAVATGIPRHAFAGSTNAPLSFGFQNTSWGTIGMIAQAENTFAKAGANVTIYTFDSGNSARDAMVSGRVEIGVLGGTPFVVGAAKGDMVAIGIAMYAGATDSVVAGTKTGIKTIKDLKGRKVATQLGSVTNYVFENKILPSAGLTASDIRVVNVPFQNHIAALAAGSVDAFAGVEPFPSVAQVNGLGYVVVDYSKFDMLPVVLAANRSAVERKPEAIVAFLRGWLAAVKIFKQNRTKATDIVLGHFQKQGFGINRKVIEVMLSKLDVNPDYVPGLTKYFADESSVLVKQHKIASAPDWSKLLDRQFLREAMNA